MSEQPKITHQTDPSPKTKPLSYFETTRPPYFAAEFDYFRLPAERWSLLLTRLRQFGCRLVTIGIPWLWHEIESGQVDFTGATNPRRNLLNLFELCQALNLVCLIDLGPLTGHGLLNDGLPFWLTVDDRLKATERWLRAVSHHITPHQWSNGPVIALHLDPQTLQPQPPTYNKHLTDVKWPIWLRKKYGHVEAVNAAYGTAYTTISRAEFPRTQDEPSSPIENDAHAFLNEQRLEAQASQQQLLSELGWQVPILSPAASKAPFPQVQNVVVSQLAHLAEFESNNTIYNIRQPIQVDPDPSDIGIQPMWAGGAPIRSDGSVRRMFYLARHVIWLRHDLAEKSEDEILTTSFENGGLVSSSRDTALKLRLPPGTKPGAYRLRLTGELLADAKIRPLRGKLSGLYSLDDEATQNDLVFWLNDPAAQFEGLPYQYLSILLAAQAFSLNHCADLAKSLSQSLSIEPEKAPETLTAPAKFARSSYTMNEARRGLREADAALRKALRSIGGLESGFDTILGRREPDPDSAATPSVVVTPAIFEGPARDSLVGAGQVCAKIEPELRATAEMTQHVIEAPFTASQYQDSYASAIATAATCHELLLDVIARLRVKVASEQLPLVTWRVLDQIQAISEELRWGVLRG